jgi:hypothetical protein
MRHRDVILINECIKKCPKQVWKKPFKEFVDNFIGYINDPILKNTNNIVAVLSLMYPEVDYFDEQSWIYPTDPPQVRISGYISQILIEIRVINIWKEKIDRKDISDYYLLRPYHQIKRNYKKMHVLYHKEFNKDFRHIPRLKTFDKEARDLRLKLESNLRKYLEEKQ